MPYLIDSDIVIDYLNQNTLVVELLNRLVDEAFAISVLTYLEVFQGTLRAEDPQQAQQDLMPFIESAPILPVTKEIAERCARLRKSLRDQGKRPERRAFDLVIAATAIEHGLSLVTRNVRDYQDVPELSLLSGQ